VANRSSVSATRTVLAQSTLLVISVFLCVSCVKAIRADTDGSAPDDHGDEHPDSGVAGVTPSARRDAGSAGKGGPSAGRDGTPAGKPAPSDRDPSAPDAATSPSAARASCGVLDLLFVVDNSGSMRQEQSALKDQFPKLITTLTTGRTSAGTSFQPAKDIHLGVVSTDMGIPGIANNFPGCNTQRHVNGGDDGVLQHPGNTAPGCFAEYPPWISFAAGGDVGKVATDFGCIAALGTTGCGFEQQLEAGLKALWPRDYVDADGNIFPPEKNPILFLSTTAEGRYGHGDVSLTQGGNAGFLRSDRATGVSQIAIIVVTDEEDCSSKNTGHFVSTNDPSNPLSKQGINLRCYYNKQNLFDPERYIKGYQGLRPGNEQLVVYGAIVGVPVDLVSAEARADVDWNDQTSRDAYYDNILNDSRMQERPMNENIPAIANLVPSCTRTDSNGERADADPPRRMVEVAKGMGANAVVQSICQDELGVAVDAIVERLAPRLTANCAR